MTLDFGMYHGTTRIGKVLDGCVDKYEGVVVGIVRFLL
jgi:hypothetical protein